MKKAAFECIVLIVIALFSPYNYSKANMASNFQQGTRVSNILTSDKIDIVSEIINVRVIPDSSLAYFDVLYNISVPANKSSIIPLLFFAENVGQKDFKVFVDGKETPTVNFGSLDRSKNILNNEFKKYFQKDSNELSSPGLRDIYGLKYFEISLPKGRHEIRIQYTAYSYTVKKETQTENYFTYELWPAKYWKSFDSLTINISLDKPSGYVIMTNLCEKSSYSQESHTSTWQFDRLPLETMQINYYAISRKIDSSEKSIKSHWLVQYIKNNIWMSIGILLTLFILIRSQFKK